MRYVLPIAFVAVVLIYAALSEGSMNQRVQAQTNTDTPTATATDTATMTATTTATDTTTATATETPTETATATATTTVAATATATATRTKTSTATVTSSTTSTPTPTNTPIATTTDTAIATVTATTTTALATATDTATSSATSSATLTTTETRIPTVTSTPTMPIAYLPVVRKPENTPTPTITPTPFLSPTQTASATSAPTLSLRNGTFEEGNAGWETVDDAGDVIRTTFPGNLRPHGGSWAAWLGGSDDSTTAIVQRVTIPSDRKYLVYWRWIASEDICDQDVGGVSLTNDDGEVTDDEIVDAVLLCDDNNTGGWQRRSIDVSRFAGQTRTLIMLVSNDVVLNSNMFVDDVSFQKSPGIGNASTPAGNDPRLAAPQSGQSHSPASNEVPSGIVEQMRLHVH